MIEEKSQGQHGLDNEYERKRAPFLTLFTVKVDNGSSKETEVRVCAADVGTTDHCLIWTGSQQTRIIKKRRGRKLCRWRVDKLEVKEKQSSNEKWKMKIMPCNFPSCCMGTTKTDIERDNAGAGIIEGLEQLVKNTASKAIGKMLAVRNGAVKWWEEEVKRAIRVRRGTRKKYNE